MSWFNKPSKPEAKEIAAVQFGCGHIKCTVYRDAEDRPYVVIFDQYIRLDEPKLLREVIWLKRREQNKQP